MAKRSGDRALALARQAMAKLKEKDGETAFRAAQEALDLVHEAEGIGKVSSDLVSEALEVIVKVCADRSEPREGVIITNQELSRFKMAGDTIGEAAALLALVLAHVANKDIQAAISSGESALVRMIVLDNLQMEARVSLSLCQPYTTMEQCQMAKASASRAGQIFQQLGDKKREAEANQLYIAACEACGEEPPNSAHRDEARLVLQDIEKAVRARDSVAYADAMEILELTGGVVKSDVAAVLKPLSAEDPEQDVAEFIGGVMPQAMPSSIVQTSVTSGLGKDSVCAETCSVPDFYYPIRANNLFYGPRYRQCHAWRVPGESEVFGCLRLSSNVEEWEKEGFEPATLDAFAHMSFIHGIPSRKQREAYALAGEPESPQDDGPKEGPRIPFFMEEGLFCPNKRALSLYVYHRINGPEEVDQACFPAQ